MKLEAGKKYLTRNGEEAKCLAVWTEEMGGRQATVHINYNFCSYRLNGQFDSDSRESPLDIVSEYVEPKEPRRVWLYEPYQKFSTTEPIIEKPEDWTEFVEVVK